MNLRNLSAWSIRNPIVPIVMFIGLTLAGVVAFIQMDVNSSPDIDFPGVNVFISQPGAAPTEIETQITQKVEAAVRSINGVDEIQSSAREGGSQTFVQFAIGTDANDAVNEVKNAVDQIRGDLPDGILEPRVSKEEIGGNGPIGYFAVRADDMTMEQLSWFVDDTVSRRLLAIEGMASVGRAGGVDREIRVVLDPARMQSLGVTASQINQTLRQVNTDAAGGQAEIAGSRQSVRVLGNAQDAYALGQTNINLSGGRSVKLADVAEVYDGFSEQSSIAKIRGQQVVTFSLERAKGYSDVTVYDQALAAIDELQEQNPSVHFTQIYTSVEYTKDQYETSMEAMIEGAVLAIVVVFLFLRDWRATIISAIAIPLSAIPSFWFMDLMGFTLNELSLLALSLVAGVLVDDAIVEIENIVRHMRMGKTAYQASIDAADEIGLPVVATTFSIVAVFLPVGLMPGISGQFFKNFGLTVVVAVLMSLLVARMITPMIAAYFLHAKGHAPHGEGWLMDRYLKILNWSLDTSDAEHYRDQRRGMDGRVSLGARFFSSFLDHRMWCFGIGVFSLLITVGLLYFLPQQFQPLTDSDSSRVNIEMVPGTTIEQSEAVSDKVAALLNEQPEVRLVMERVREGGATLFVMLKDERDATSIEFERRLAQEFQNVADARVTFASQSGGGGTGRDISVMLTGSDPELLKSTAQTLVEQMSGVDGVVAPRIAADIQRPELLIVPRLDLAAQLGVTTAALSQTIRIATIGEIDQSAAKFSLSDRQIPIRVMLPKTSRQDISTIENLPVPTSNGGSVPLKRVAEIKFGAGPTQIQRYNQSRRIFVGADLGEGALKGPVTDAINKLPIMQNLPAG
ncbi:MAG TPA: efflux RND transporter permease subunit, partial [Sphingomonadaceae bacterium]|nr:efflux RND transporter permease subunit [Sphingomonadaceae bacterium]